MKAHLLRQDRLPRLRSGCPNSEKSRQAVSAEIAQHIRMDSPTDTHSRFGVGLNISSHAPDWIIETEQRFRSRMGAIRQTLRLRFVVKTMSAAVVHVPDSLLGFSGFFDSDHLDTHRHCSLAFETADHLSEIDDFRDVGVFSRYFSDQFAHGSPPHTLSANSPPRPTRGT